MSSEVYTNGGPRWSPKRKRAVLLQIDDGLISESQARARWEISAEEIASWRRNYARRGTSGLAIKELGERVRQRRLSRNSII